MTNLPPIPKWQEVLNQAHLDHKMQIETYLRARIKPKPQWMPKPVWKWLLRELFVLEILKPEGK